MFNVHTQRACASHTFQWLWSDVTCTQHRLAVSPDKRHTNMTPGQSLMQQYVCVLAQMCGSVAMRVNYESNMTDQGPERTALLKHKKEPIISSQRLTASHQTSAQK